MARNRRSGGGADEARRRLLQGLGGALGAAALGCGSSGTPNETSEGAGGATSSSQASSSRSSSRSSSHHASSSGSGGHGGEGGQGGQGGGGMIWTPEQKLSRIDHVVVLMMENRSFDHVLGSLRLREGNTAVDGLTGFETNPDANGVHIPIFELDDFTVESPPHDWDPVHAQWNLGANDGFVREFSGPNQQEVMGYHIRSQLPVTYALADQAALCERWYCSLLAGTWPNRFYLHGATSQGTKGNTPVTGFRSVFDLLDDKGVDKGMYYSDVPWCSGAYFKTSDLHEFDTFLDDCASGNLPPFSILDPAFFGDDANDDHPDHDVQLGQALISTVVNAIGQSPAWSKTLFVLTYDEHGGFFDHVAPPTTFDDDPEFAQLGFRVPSFVISPFAKRGVVDATLEHVSVLRTMQLRYGLDQINARMGVTNDLSVCLDPDTFDAPRPPPVLPMVPISLARLELQRGRRRLHADQPELARMMDGGVIPRHLDKRGQGFERTKRWLRRAADLGAVKLI